MFECLAGLDAIEVVEEVDAELEVRFFDENALWILFDQGPVQRF